VKKLVIATRNEGKAAEFRRLLAELPFETLSLTDFPEVPEIEEYGCSFTENALIKAKTVVSLTGELALADDSGLEVEALSGRPGLHSARFSGPGSTDEANNRKLLHELEGVPAEQRTASFRAAIAIAGPGITSQVVEGVCEGSITLAPRGEGGFGYDPLFYVPEVGKTFAEMEPAEKNAFSHRARAFAAALEILQQLS